MIEKAQNSRELVIAAISQAEGFFEPYLENLRLSRSAILEQDTEQLQLSLMTLGMLIEHSEQLGSFGVALSVRGDVIISGNRKGELFEIGALPLLLSRKQLVLDSLRRLKAQPEVKTLLDLVEQVSDEASREALRLELSSLQQKSYPVTPAAKIGGHDRKTQMTIASDQQENASAGARGADGELGGRAYQPVEEALRAADKALEVLGEANSDLGQLRNGYAAEVAQTAGLPEKVDRLAVAVEALTRTVTALSAEARAGRDVSPLVPVAVMQKPVVDGAAEEAVAAAPDGPVQKVLRKVLGTLKRAAEWLWSMLIHLATVREWTLGGEVHIPGLAKASLNITFGG